MLVLQALFDSKTGLKALTGSKLSVALDANGVHFPEIVNAPLVRGRIVVDKLVTQTAHSKSISVFIAIFFS